jgi:hypothetical protein
MGRLVHRIVEALRRARAPIAILAIVSVCSLAIGAVLATSGNSFALSQRDAIVGAAQISHFPKTAAGYDAFDSCRRHLGPVLNPCVTYMRTSYYVGMSDDPWNYPPSRKGWEDRAEGWPEY